MKSLNSRRASDFFGMPLLKSIPNDLFRGIVDSIRLPPVIIQQRLATVSELSSRDVGISIAGPE